MQFSQLATVKHRVAVGQPLPFNVRNADHTLLLARGQVVDTFDQMEALFTRGALVDIAELRAAVADPIKDAPPEQLPKLWNQCLDRVGQALQGCTQEGFGKAIEEVSAPVQSLIERDSDLAIFQVLRQDGNSFTQYGVSHSIHAAITSFLVAQRLGWDAASVQKVFKVALTMNVSMLELQGRLAEQTTPVTPEQREQIHSHPQRSVEMLELSGITDREWLDAVADHHVAPDGTGYPAGRHQVSDLAALVRRADIYTAKLSPRGNRDAMAADRAGRAMFMYDPGNSMTAALVKEFGVYPPGCFVRLVSGETAVVVKRGPSVITPLVAALTTPTGAALIDPVPRDTSKREFTIASVIGEKWVKVKPAPEKLMQLALA
jgi:HD-GYP domain-containing protein (c-di-GMP phosphodiesterase class II)